MDSFLFTLISFIVALGVLITVHEFGHFMVARKLGVKVITFSIGFGRALWSRRESALQSGQRRLFGGDGTEYVIAAIPLGGYVRMLDEREGEVAEEERHRAFNRQSLGVRTAIVAAGPLFNFLFAILAFWIVFVSGDTGTRPLVGAVAPGSIAEQAGLQPGDELVSVAGRPTPTWESTVFGLIEAAGDEQIVLQVRDEAGYQRRLLLPGERLSKLSEDGALLEGLGLTPMRPRVEPVIGQVVEGQPAAEAGLKVGDRILGLEGRAIDSWNEFVQKVRKSPGKTLALEVQRNDRILGLKVHVAARESAGGVKIGRIGAGVHVPPDLYEKYRVEVRYGPIESVGIAVTKTWDMSWFMLKMLGRMVTGEASVRNLGGPISIAQSAGRSASYGPVYFLKFLAMISISLGVLNLLPIPVLDGGHLFFFLIEAVRGRPLSERAQAQGQRIGMILLLALMGLAFYIDLSRLLGS